MTRAWEASGISCGGCHGDDATLPARGWPWPWDDSRMTDYAYAFDGRVLVSCFGHEWLDPASPPPPDEDGDVWCRGGKVAVFPDMRARQNVRLDRGSGLVIVSAPRAEEN